MNAWPFAIGLGVVSLFAVLTGAGRAVVIVLLAGALVVAALSRRPQ